MKIAVLLIGLPASGKTHYALEKYSDWFFIDDPKELSKDILIPLKIYKPSNVVVADPHFCHTTACNKATSILEELGYAVEKVYFENNPDQCIKNMEIRLANNDLRNVHRQILEDTNIYFIPKSVITVPVWSCNFEGTY